MNDRSTAKQARSFASKNHCLMADQLMCAANRSRACNLRTRKKWENTLEIKSLDQREIRDTA